VAAVAAAAAVWVTMHVAARMADALWGRPRRLEAHFAAQGVRGPPYRFLLGSVREMVALMAEASSKPMSPPTSHNALPRVLAFYHYWRKIYGEFFAPASAAAMCARGALCGHVVASQWMDFWLHLLLDLFPPRPAPSVLCLLVARAHSFCLLVVSSARVMAFFLSLSWRRH
jgi:hypothetical protein